MPCKLFDQISGKIHRDKDLYDLISDTMVFETGRRHLCNRSLYYREKFLFRNKTGARKNLSLSLSLRSRKIEKSGACIGECVPRACVRPPPPPLLPSGSSRSLAGYIQRARLPSSSYQAATLAFVDSAKCPWIFPGLPMPADQPDIGRVVRCKRFLVTSRPV